MTAHPDSAHDHGETRDPLVRRHPAGAARPAPVGTVPEIGGRKDGSEPTRFGDWEKHGRCIDF